MDSGSTVNTTMITNTITKSVEDTTDELGSGDDEDKYVTKLTRPTTTTAEFTMATGPIDEDGGSGMSGDGSGDPAGKGPSSWPFFTSTRSPKTVLLSTFGDGSTTEGAVESTVNHLESTTKMTTTESSSYFSSTAAETRKPSSTTRTMEADPVNDIEVINSPTAHPDRSTVKKTSTMGNVIQEPTEDPTRIGNTAKSRRNEQSGQAISFTTGIIIGVVVGALLAVLVILLLVYRLRKKDEGSYSLEEPITGYTKQEPGSPVSGKEYLA